MADADKNILITPNTGQASLPKIEFTGFDGTTLTLNVLDDGTISIEGSAGQLFSVSNSLSGIIFSVNDVSGIPSIEVLDDGTVNLAGYGGAVNVGAAITADAYKENVTSTSGTSQTFDLALGSVFWHSMTGNGTFSFTNTPATDTTQTVTIITEQSTANSTITWPASVLWPGNVQPTQSTAAGEIDFWAITVINKGGTVYYLGNLISKDAS